MTRLTSASYRATQPTSASFHMARPTSASFQDPTDQRNLSQDHTGSSVSKLAHGRAMYLYSSDLLRPPNTETGGWYQKLGSDTEENNGQKPEQRQGRWAVHPRRDREWVKYAKGWCYLVEKAQCANSAKGQGEGAKTTNGWEEKGGDRETQA